jgi:hypothetical protein
MLDKAKVVLGVTGKGSPKMGYLFRRVKITSFGLRQIYHFLHRLKITSFVNKYAFCTPDKPKE